VKIYFVSLEEGREEKEKGTEVTRCMGCFCSGLELGLTFTAVVSHER
jgi:hypothetical protein